MVAAAAMSHTCSNRLREGRPRACVHLAPSRPVVPVRAAAAADVVFVAAINRKKARLKAEPREGAEENSEMSQIFQRTVCCAE